MTRTRIVDRCDHGHCRDCGEVNRWEALVGGVCLGCLEVRARRQQAETDPRVDLFTDIVGEVPLWPDPPDDLDL